MTIDQVEKVFFRWLYFGEEDKSVVRVMFATLIANRWYRSLPLWVQIVGPSGSGKTQLLVTLQELDGYTYFTSTLTYASLLSGYQGGEDDPSLLPQLDHRVLIIKDFTPILEMDKSERDKVIGLLRDAYDGQCSRNTGVGRLEAKSRFGVLTGVTPIVDMYQALHQQLGERFLLYRLRVRDSIATIQRAESNSGHEHKMAKELSRAATDFLMEKFETLPEVNDVKIPKPIRDRIIYTAHLVALARSKAVRKRDGELSYLPQPEVGNRLVKQFLVLMKALMVVADEKKPSKMTQSIVARMAQDTLPKKASKAMGVLLSKRASNGKAMDISECGQLAGMSYYEIKPRLEDFLLSGLVESPDTNEYTVPKHIRVLVKKSLF